MSTYNAKEITQMKRLIAKWVDGYCNIPVSLIEKDGDIIFAYRDSQFIGMFDLRAMLLLYVSDKDE